MTGELYQAKPKTKTCRASQWPVAELDRTLESSAHRIIEWVIANGGEAEYLPVGPLAKATGQNPLIRIRKPSGHGLVRPGRIDRDVYARPGDYVVMGEEFVTRGSDVGEPGRVYRWHAFTVLRPEEFECDWERPS